MKTRIKLLKNHLLFLAFFIMCDLTTCITIKVHIGVALDGISQFVLLHLGVEGAVGPVGEGGHAGLHAAAGASGVSSPPRVRHHQQTLVWRPH